MRKLIYVMASIVISTVLIPGPASAVGERPYWPAIEIREVPEGCIKWNWQELSYYNYCPRGIRPGSKALRVRG